MNALFESNTTISYADEDYSNTITTSEAYNKRLEILDESESLTIQYTNTLKNLISQALLLKFELTENQLHSLISFLISVIKIEQNCDCELRDIAVTSSVEEEIVFYRKSQNGISLLSIDADGDILFNFTGFKAGFNTERFVFGEEIDFEILIYNFLSR